MLQGSKITHRSHRSNRISPSPLCLQPGILWTDVLPSNQSKSIERITPRSSFLKEINEVTFSPQSQVIMPTDDTFKNTEINVDVYLHCASNIFNDSMTTTSLIVILNKDDQIIQMEKRIRRQNRPWKDKCRQGRQLRTRMMKAAHSLTQPEKGLL